jgi:hypothetical protein
VCLSVTVLITLCSVRGGDDHSKDSSDVSTPVNLDTHFSLLAEKQHYGAKKVNYIQYDIRYRRTV